MVGLLHNGLGYLKGLEYMYYMYNLIFYNSSEIENITRSVIFKSFI